MSARRRSIKASCFNRGPPHLWAGQVGRAGSQPAGRAGGKVKTGMHIDLKGEAGTRVGLTVQQVLGVPLNTWGTRSNETSKTFTEILA